jgi:hypothetical protein
MAIRAPCEAGPSRSRDREVSSGDLRTPTTRWTDDASPYGTTDILARRCQRATPRRRVVQAVPKFLTSAVRGAVCRHDADESCTNLARPVALARSSVFGILSSLCNRYNASHFTRRRGGDEPLAQVLPLLWVRQARLVAVPARAKGGATHLRRGPRRWWHGARSPPRAWHGNRLWWNFVMSRHCFTRVLLSDAGCRRAGAPRETDVELRPSCAITAVPRPSLRALCVAHRTRAAAYMQPHYILGGVTIQRANRSSVLNHCHMGATATLRDLNGTMDGEPGGDPLRLQPWASALSRYTPAS